MIHYSLWMGRQLPNRGWRMCRILHKNAALLSPNSWRFTRKWNTLIKTNSVCIELYSWYTYIWHDGNAALFCFDSFVYRPEMDSFQSIGCRLINELMLSEESLRASRAQLQPWGCSETALRAHRNGTAPINGYSDLFDFFSLSNSICFLPLPFNIQIKTINERFH